MRQFLFLFIVVIGAKAAAQTLSTEVDELPTFAVQSIFAALEVPSQELRIRRTEEQHDQYKPNQRTAFKVGADFGSVSASVSQLLSQAKTQNGKTDYTQINLSHYGAKSGWNVFWGRFKGFYRQDGEQDEKAAAISPDMQLQQYGGTYIYAFADNNFSLAATGFNESEATAKGHGGSWLGSVYVHRFEVTGSGEFFNQGKNYVNETHLTSAGIGGGYGYLWNWSAQSLAAAVLIEMGPGILSTQTNRQEFQHERVLSNGFHVNIEYNWRFAQNWMTTVHADINSIASGTGISDLGGTAYQTVLAVSYKL